MDEMENRLVRLPGALLPWYRENRRVLPWREEVSAYRTWVSEIMLQQTRVAAVIPYFQRFMAAYPTVEDLAACDEGELMRLWAGLGYYSRARNLRRAARVIAEEYGGAFPRTYEELMALPGVGDYTAGAILSIAFGEPVPAVDGNVLRVAARVGGCELDILDPKNRRQFRRRMEAVMPRQEPGAFNQALMDLGAGICLPGGAPCAIPARRRTSAPPGSRDGSGSCRCGPPKRKNAWRKRRCSCCWDRRVRPCGSGRTRDCWRACGNIPMCPAG